MYRVLEFIVLDGVGFYGGYRTRKEAEAFAKKIGGKVATLPSRITRKAVR